MSKHRAFRDTAIALAALSLVLPPQWLLAGAPSPPVNRTEAPTGQTGQSEADSRTAVPDRAGTSGRPEVPIRSDIRRRTETSDRIEASDQKASSQTGAPSLAESVESTAAVGREPPTRPWVRDVGLSEGGTLKGRVLDGEGHPMARRMVMVQKPDGTVCLTTTDGNGEFQCLTLRGGVHHVICGRSGRVVRLWAAGTAPPSAGTQLMIVQTGETIRAQHEPGPILTHWESLKCHLTNPFIVGGIVAAAVAIPVAIHNANQDRDRDTGS